MKLLHDNTGKIYYAVYDTDWFKFFHTTNTPLTEFEIDKVDPDNKEICIDLVRTLNKTDEDGQSKYFISNNDLCENEGWEEYYEEI